MRKRGLIFIVCLLFLFAPVLLFAFRGLDGINVVLRRGGSIWPTVSRDDPRLSPAVRLALSGKVGRLGRLTWAEPRPGFEVGELPILVDDMLVDRLLLARIDPAHWRFSVHSAPAGDHDLDRWMRELRAVLVINGSY